MFVAFGKVHEFSLGIFRAERLWARECFFHYGIIGRKIVQSTYVGTKGRIVYGSDSLVHVKAPPNPFGV